MASTLTSLLKLFKATPGSNEQFRTTDVNSNWDKIDQNIGAFICTSTTRPASPFQTQRIYETDTTAYLSWTGTKWTQIGGPLPSSRSYNNADAPIAAGGWIDTPLKLQDEVSATSAGHMTLEPTNNRVKLLTAGLYFFVGNIWVTRPDVALRIVKNGTKTFAQNPNGDPGSASFSVTIAASGRCAVNDTIELQMFCPTTFNIKADAPMGPTDLTIVKLSD